jgi:hypothetical protein
MPYGNPELSPLRGGSTGGVTEPASGAGRGGGVLQLVAGASITVATGGVIAVTGKGGAQFGIGGGSGGALLLEAPLLKINGTLSANGGAGANGLTGGPDGTLTAEPARGTKEDGPGRKVTVGGNGGAGTTPAGTAGTTTGDASSGPSDSARAGGGGGAGRIRLNSRCGAVGLGPRAIITPALCEECGSQGRITPR